MAPYLQDQHLFFGSNQPLHGQYVSASFLSAKLAQFLKQFFIQGAAVLGNLILLNGNQTDLVWTAEFPENG
jgi:hypothetical protein